MKRRNFLSLIGAASVAPALPFGGVTPAAAAGYNRYMYGLAVFHARTRASVTAADLMGRLRVSAATAEAIMGEMSAKGVLTPALNVATGAMRASSPNVAQKDAAQKIVTRVVDTVFEDAPQDQDLEDTGTPS